MLSDHDARGAAQRVRFSHEGPAGFPLQPSPNDQVGVCTAAVWHHSHEVFSMPRTLCWVNSVLCVQVAPGLGETLASGTRGSAWALTVDKASGAVWNGAARPARPARSLGTFSGQSVLELTSKSCGLPVSFFMKSFRHATCES